MIAADKPSENSFANNLGYSQIKKVKIFRRKPRKNLETWEIQKLLNAYGEINTAAIKTFTDFPLSQKTQRGLKNAKYEKPTAIQRESIGVALKGRDVLGAAKTGSGKTVAFLVPLLERLYLERWTTYDGLGALVITPTRELAYQIFEVLRKIGSHHEFSAGLIIGGKDLKFERKRMDKCNIVICTPGRLLQHMDENPLFDCTNLRILVLDEADRILDLGFEKTVNSIIENLPQERQTLLFSATQTRSVKDLARLSLQRPVYVSVHEHAAHRTPEGLQQSYLVCDTHDKLNLLWSFVKTHLKQKILVFMASCKQVKYVYETFCRMKPGMSVLALYGSLHQLRRMAIYDEFCQKQHAVLFATDIAARGLDFPAVNWVVQLDCPEDVKTYIHRVGRTARYQGNGEALLVLLPSEEESMIRQLTEDKVPVKQILINKKKFVSVQRKLEELCSRDHVLKESAQRAFVSYIKSVFLMKDKSVFKVKDIDTDAYARSLGLAVTPRIRFLSRQQKLQAASSNKKVLDRMQELKLNSDADENDEDNDEGSHTEEEDSLSKPTSQIPFDFHDSDDSEEEFLVAKTANSYHDQLFSENESGSKEVTSCEEELKKARQRALTKAAVAKKMLKKKVKPNNKVVFDDEGKPVEKFPTKLTSQLALELSKKEEGFNIQVAKQIMEEEDKIDKQLFRQRVKALHKEKKAKLREERKLRKQESRPEKAQDDSSASEDEILNEYIEQLPDPDKVYGKEADEESKSKQSSDEESGSTEGSNEESISRKGTEEEARLNKKKNTKRRQRKESEDESASEYSEIKPPKLKKRKKESILDTNLELKDEEELALHLLSQQ